MDAQAYPEGLAAAKKRLVQAEEHYLAVEADYQRILAIPNGRKGGGKIAKKNVISAYKHAKQEKEAAEDKLRDLELDMLDKVVEPTSSVILENPPVDHAHLNVATSTYQGAIPTDMPTPTRVSPDGGPLPVTPAVSPMMIDPCEMVMPSMVQTVDPTLANPNGIAASGATLAANHTTAIPNQVATCVNDSMMADFVMDVGMPDVLTEDPFSLIQDINSKDYFEIDDVLNPILKSVPVSGQQNHVGVSNIKSSEDVEVSGGEPSQGKLAPNGDNLPGKEGRLNSKNSTKTEDEGNESDEDIQRKPARKKAKKDNAVVFESLDKAMKQRLTQEGNHSIAQFLQNPSKNPLDFGLRKSIRLNQDFLPHAATTSRELALHCLETNRRNIICMYHQKNKDYDTIDGTGEFALCGIPHRRSVMVDNKQKRIMRPPGHLHCGCNEDVVLMDFYFWKTWVLTSDVSGEHVEEGMRNDRLAPRHRAFVVKAFTDATGLTIDDLYRNQESEVSHEQTKLKKQIRFLVEKLNALGGKGGDYDEF